MKLFLVLRSHKIS